MCTLTFIPRNNGYYLAMNRDERISRGVASPPTAIEQEGVEAVYPRDIDGGTWIAASSRGIAFALLNWNDVDVRRSKTRSRGSVIPELISSDCMKDAHAALGGMNLESILPFRLVGIFAAKKLMSQWRWNQNSIEHERFPWRPRQWCSSSLSDSRAFSTRQETYNGAQHQTDFGSVPWLRRLHASHDAGQGPFSICVHRKEVRTVSYTELECTAESVRCNYYPGSPCQAEAGEHLVSIGRIEDAVALDLRVSA